MSDENGNGNTSSEIKTPIGSVSFSGKKTAEFIAILSLCLLFVLAYVLWDHKVEARSNGDTLITALQAMVQAQREQNCLISIKQDEREQKAEFCRRISR